MTTVPSLKSKLYGLDPPVIVTTKSVELPLQIDAVPAIDAAEEGEFIVKVSFEPTMVLSHTPVRFKVCAPEEIPETVKLAAPETIETALAVCAPPPSIL